MHRPSILLVDDAPEFVGALAAYFDDDGWTVTTADDGVHALEALRSSTLPDVVFSDWMMPGLTGPELIDAMRADAALDRIPVVLMSAYFYGPDHCPPVVRRGAAACLNKFGSPDEFLSTARSLVPPQ